MTAQHATLAPELMALCPYPGLDAFTAQYRRYFIGRRRDTELLVSNLYASPLTILYGASGVGKTSVLLAGVVPRIEEAGDAVVVVHRTWQSPSLVAALGPALVRAVEERTGQRTGIAGGELPLDAVVEALLPFWDGPFLVVFDQFEEYFLSPLDRTSPDSFDAAFARAVNRRDLDVHFMISLREDSLSGLDRFRHRIPGLLSNLYRLEHLTRDEIRRAIVEPLATLRAEHPDAPVPTAAEPTLPEVIVSDQVAFEQGADGGGNVAKEERFVTPFLQLVLRRLWEEEARAGSTILRAATFERLGRATGVVRLRIQDALLALSPDEQRVAASVLRYLVTPSGAKVALGVGDLEGYVSAPPGELRAIALTLSAQEQRILRAVQHPSGRPELTRFEIYHDALARPLLDWRVAFDRAEAEREALAQAKREQEARDEARRRRLAARVRMFSLGAVALTAILGGVWGLRQFSGQAAARELAARATTLIEENRGLSLLLSLEALRRDPESAEGDEMLRRALFEAGEVAQAPLGSDPDALILSPDGRWLLALSSGDTTHVLATGSLTDTLNIWNDSASVVDARFSADSRFLAVASSDRSLRVFDIDGGALVSYRTPVCVSVPISVAITRDAAELFVSCDDGQVRGWRRGDTTATGSEVVPAWEGNYELHTGPDGRRIVAYADGEAPRLLDVERFALGPPLLAGEGAPDDLLFTADDRLIGVHWTAPQLDELPLAPGRTPARWRTHCTPTALDVGRSAAVVLIGCDDGAMSQAVFPRDRSGELNAVAAANVAVQMAQAPARGGPLPELRLTGHAGGITAAEVSDDGRLGFSIGPEGATVWDLSSRRSMRSIRPASGSFSKGIFLRDNSRLATVTSDGVLQLWALDAASRMFASPGTGHLGARLSPGEGRFVVSANEREGARVWGADGSGSTWDVGVAGRLASVPAFSPDGSRLAMMWGNGEVTEFDVASRRTTWATSPQRVVRAPEPSSYSRKGGMAAQYALQGESDGDVSRGEVHYAASGDVMLTAAFLRERYSRSSGRARLVLRLHHRDDDRPRAELDSVADASLVALSPDAGTIAVALVSGEVRSYDVASGQWRRRLPPADGPPTSLVYRADGMLVATRGGDAWLFRPAPVPSTGGSPAPPPAAQRLQGGAARLSALAVSGANSLVAAGDTTGNVVVWDAATAARRCTLAGVHSDRVTALAFAPSGAVLATGSADRSVAVSSVERDGCRFLYRIQPNEEAVTGVAFRATRPPFLVVASAGGVVRRYERDLWGTPEELLALAAERLGGRQLTAAERRAYKIGASR